MSHSVVEQSRYVLAVKWPRVIREEHTGNLCNEYIPVKALTLFGSQQVKWLCIHISYSYVPMALYNEIRPPLEKMPPGHSERADLILGIPTYFWLSTFILISWPLTQRGRVSYISMRQWTSTSLVQITVYHLLGSKPLSEPLLVYCHLGHCVVILDFLA